ncbi:MAG: hypothetical protein NT145_05990 [Elusimicrobia bacterium]|nr:hypothetical protein [Elusimicrobiota bacterium]
MIDSLGNRPDTFWAPEEDEDNSAGLTISENILYNKTLLNKGLSGFHPEFLGSLA